MKQTVAKIGREVRPRGKYLLILRNVRFRVKLVPSDALRQKMNLEAKHIHAEHANGSRQIVHNHHICT